MAGQKKGFKKKFRWRGKPQRAVSSFKPKPAFMQFFEQAVGSNVTPKETASAVHFASRFRAEIESNKTSLARLRQIWSRIAPVYLNLIEPDRIENELLIINRHATISPTDNIVSLGSGPAILETFIAKNLASKGQVTCIDFSPKFVRIARSLREKFGVKNMKVFTGSATAIRLPDSSQDKVIISQTNLVDTIHWQSVIKEIFRVIKKGPAAKLVLTFALENRKELPTIRRSLSDNGFFPEVSATYARRRDHSEAIIIIASPQAKFWGKQ